MRRRKKERRRSAAALRFHRLVVEVYKEVRKVKIMPRYNRNLDRSIETALTFSDILIYLSGQLLYLNLII